MNKPDGGPAFPFAATDVSNVKFQTNGMSLRDCFAAAALSNYAYRYQNEMSAADIASQCYSLANAMLAERSKVND